MTERASPARKSRRRSDGQALGQSDTIAAQSSLAAALPSQSRRSAPRQLPQRGSHWHVGQLSSGRAKHDVSEAVVLRCLGQRQLDKVRLSRSRCPRKQGPPFCILSNLRRPVESEPACQSLSLWERWHCEAMTERASPAGKSRCAAIGRLFVRAILSRRRAVWQRPSPLSRACARQLPQRGSHWHVGRAPSSYNLSVSLRSPAPLVGEPLAKPFTLRGLPRPPLGRGGGSASAVTERLSPGSVTPAA